VAAMLKISIGELGLLREPALMLKISIAQQKSPRFRPFISVLLRISTKSVLVEVSQRLVKALSTIRVLRPSRCYSCESPALRQAWRSCLQWTPGV
jgi:hypothetical protein